MPPVITTIYDHFSHFANTSFAKYRGPAREGFMWDGRADRGTEDTSTVSSAFHELGYDEILLLRNKLSVPSYKYSQSLFFLQLRQLCSHLTPYVFVYKSVQVFM